MRRRAARRGGGTQASRPRATCVSPIELTAIDLYQRADRFVAPVKMVTLTEPVRDLGARMIKTTLGDARFFRRSGPYPLAVVTDRAAGIADDLELLLEGVAPLQTAGP